jgi:hypothetical protein
MPFTFSPAVTVQCLSLSLLQLLFNAFHFLSFYSHPLLTEQFFLLICLHSNFHILLHLLKIFFLQTCTHPSSCKTPFSYCFCLFFANFIVSCCCSTLFLERLPSVLPVSTLSTSITEQFYRHFCTFSL